MQSSEESAKISVEVVRRLVNTGKEILKTKEVMDGMAGPYEVVSDAKYNAWRTQVLNYLSISLTETNHYFMGVRQSLRTGSYPSNVIDGLEHLEKLIEDIDTGLFLQQKVKTEPFILLRKIFDKFYKVAVQLRSRHGERETLDISDEYDVQDLLHALLMIEFDDIEPEDWISKFAGTGSRVDFALREYQIVVETKKTSQYLKNKRVADELIIDIERYSKNPQ